MASKPGMGKYKAQIGPYDYEPLEVRRAYWLAELKSNTEWLNEAPGNQTAKRRLREASAALAKIGQTAQAA